MFTGLIQHMGRVESAELRAGGTRLVVDTLSWTHTPSAGDSISINGVCLTVVENAGGTLSFDCVPETLARTTVGSFTPGTPVNLEHAARADTLMGGHTVQGHVDCLATIDSIESDGQWTTVRLKLDDEPANAIRAIVPKGSVAIDGISLTIASVDPASRSFGVALIPETLARTTLGTADEGDRVNIETDILARAVAFQLEHYFKDRPFP